MMHLDTRSSFQWRDSQNGNQLKAMALDAVYGADRALAEAYAAVLRPELEDLARAGCQLIQFDEPAWTAFPEDSVWAAEVLNHLTMGLMRKSVSMSAEGTLTASALIRRPIRISRKPFALFASTKSFLNMARWDMT